MPADFEQAIKEWSDEMMIYNQLLVQGFYTRDYRCHYKCYFRSNCYGLPRMHHRRSCVRLPCAPHTKFGLCGVRAFKVDWNHCGYRSLRPVQKNKLDGGLFNYQFYVDEI